MTMEKVTFDIETQRAAAIATASAAWETLELRRTIARAQAEVSGLGLPPPTLEAVNRSFDAAAREAAEPKPDRYRVAEHLGTAARTLEEAGALGGDAGDALLQALRRATQLLGPAGLAAIGIL